MADVCGDGAGGISGLVELIQEHGEALDADLQHYYRLSLSDWAAGRVTTRRLGVLLAGLPAEGTALHRKMLRQPGPKKKSEPPEDWWTPERSFQAMLINLFRGYIWARSDPDRRGPAPEPIGPPSWRNDGDVVVPNEVALNLLRSVAPSSSN